jgi:hypothetical protein
MPNDIDRAELINAAHVGVLFSLNLSDNRFTRSLVDRIFGKMINAVIDFGIEFNRRIGTDGIQYGCRWASERCGAPVHSTGQENIPPKGPLLLAANHPGYFDSVALLSQVPRDDVKVIVAVTYFNFLPNAVPYLIYTDRSPRANIRAVREAIKHLKNGGALLLFPTGHNDPDPDVLPGAQQRYDQWSDSVSLLMRKIPDTRLVLTAISGIVARGYLKHPLARIQPNVQFKQRVAELFQIFDQFTRRRDTPLASPRLTFAPPLTLPDLGETEEGGINQQIIDRARRLLLRHSSASAQG